MATNKNITMKQYNGLDYDTLYPKTTPEQVGAVSYESQTLTDGQKNQARYNINAAPDGFGLGANGYPYAYTVLTADTINTINRSGLYVYEDNHPIIDAGIGNYGGDGLLLHLAHTIAHSYDAKQVFYPRAGIGNTHLERVKDTFKGWQPWEWVNPPMWLGVEYRTTDRHLGKPVYVKAINTGAFPQNGDLNITIGNPGDTTILPFRVHGVTNANLVIPGTVSSNVVGGIIMTWSGVNGVSICKTDGMLPGVTAILTVYYTKTTD